MEEQGAQWFKLGAQDRMAIPIPSHLQSFISRIYKMANVFSSKFQDGKMEYSGTVKVGIAAK